MSFTEYSYFERHLKWTHPAQYLARLKSKASKCESELSSMVTCSTNTGSSLTEKQQQAHVRHAHVRTSKPPKKRYPCPQCDSTFPFQARLWNHCLILHGLKTVWINDNLYCSKCSTRLTGGRGNGPHRCHDPDESKAEIQEGEGPGCVDRGSRFPFTGERTNICNGCGLGFKDLESLRKHSLIHSGERLYLCPLCGTVFGQLDSVNAHICIRTTEKRQEKPHQCGECGKRYRSDLSLKNHQLSHTGEKPYRCEDCGKSYWSISQLSKHKRTHAGEKKHACPDCGLGFDFPCGLRKHRCIHTRQRLYSCQEDVPNAPPPEDARPDPHQGETLLLHPVSPHLHQGTSSHLTH